MQLTASPDNMSKRSLSPAPLPPAKRVHVSSDIHFICTPTATFDTLLYDELILQIFSYLPWKDLCAISATNRNWSRLSADNQLWKSLYLTEYGRTRLRGGKGFPARADGREIKPLPGRAFTDEVKDWKWMFRISSNWRIGRCHISTIEGDPAALVHDSDHARPLSTAESKLAGRIHLLLTGAFIIAASSRPSYSPPIHFTALSNSRTHTIHVQSLKRQSPVQITALAVDQSPPSTSHVRIAVCLSNGELQVYEQHSVHMELPSRKHSYIPAARTSRTSPIVQLAYHHPVLATLSESFNLSIYDLSSESMKLTTNLSSFTCFPPASLVLSTPEPMTYKLVLTYSSPVYPAHWSIGVTEVILSTAPSGSSLPSAYASSSSSPPLPSQVRLVSTRSTRAFDLPPGWLDAAKLRSVHEQWGRKVAEVAGTQTDGKWVVLAPSDRPPGSTPFSQPSSSPSPTSLFPFSSMPLQLYRISFPSLTASSSAVPKLNFVRNLHGHTGPVAALAVADGRCVSLGADESVWVWDLEAGTGAEVAPPRVVDEDADVRDERRRLSAKGTVVFDERRIISAGADGVVVRNFDM